MAGVKMLAAVSNIQSSDIYMTVSMIMFEEDKPNLNGVRCTASFIDEIVVNRDKYVGLPLVADTKMLHDGKLDTLSHNYDPATDTFGTEIIGAFVDFQKGTSENGTPALIGVARISKRDVATCEAIASLFAQNKLKFSFEIACSHLTQLEDNTVVIDANEGNTLTALAVVSTPACPSAVATCLVAEEESNCERKEAEAMNNEVNVVEEVKDVVAEIAEEVVEASEPVVVPAEVEVSAAVEEKKDEEKTDDEKETESASCSEEKKEDEEDKECASCDPEEDKEEKKDEEEASCKKKAEVDYESLRAEIASLKDAIAALAELVKPAPVVTEEVIAEAKPEVQVAEINPFMDDIKAESNWTLLDEEPKTTAWTLI